MAPPKEAIRSDGVRVPGSKGVSSWDHYLGRNQRPNAFAAGGFDSGLSAMMHSAEEANKRNEQLWRESQAWNAAEAQKNRDWQEHMANTAHQRELADLRAAGLNPILTATGGSGAATPAGGAATHSAMSVDPSLSPSAYSAAATSAAERRRQKLMERKYEEYELGMMREQLLNFKSQRELNSANAAKILVDAQTLAGYRGALGQNALASALLTGLQGDVLAPKAAVFKELLPVVQNVATNSAGAINKMVNEVTTLLSGGGSPGGRGYATTGGGTFGKHYEQPQSLPGKILHILGFRRRKK